MHFFLFYNCHPPILRYKPTIMPRMTSKENGPLLNVEAALALLRLPPALLPLPPLPYCRLLSLSSSSTSAVIPAQYLRLSFKTVALKTTSSMSTALPGVHVAVMSSLGRLLVCVIVDALASSSLPHGRILNLSSESSKSPFTYTEKKKKATLAALVILPIYRRG